MSLSQETAAMLTVLSIIISIGTIVVAILKGRDMIAKAALEAVGSLEGRSVVLAITNEKHDRIEEKLDVLSEKLDVLASSMNNMAIRLAVIEDQRGGRREER